MHESRVKEEEVFGTTTTHTHTYTHTPPKMVTYRLMVPDMGDKSHGVAHNESTFISDCPNRVKSSYKSYHMSPPPLLAGRIPPL